MLGWTEAHTTAPAATISNRLHNLVIVTPSGKPRKLELRFRERVSLRSEMRNPRPVLRNKSIGKVMQRLLPIDTRDAIRQESVLRSHLKLGRAHVEVVADAGSMDEHQS